MKIVVLSDTHIPKRAKNLPSRLVKELKTADGIIHAGDWQSLEMVHQLQSYAPVNGVYGNTDGNDIKTIFPEKNILKLNGYTIGIVHGHGPRKTTERRAAESFSEEKPDIVIFGHSHIPFLRYVNGMLLFNPGSPTDKRKCPMYSFGILTLEQEIKVEHIFFS